MSLLSTIKGWFRPPAAPVAKGSLGAFDRPLLDTGSSGGAKMTRPYAQSVWVNRAIKLVSLPITEVPLRFSIDARGGKQLIEDPALLDWWESPALKANKQPLSFADTVEASVGSLKLAGNAFWLLDDTWSVSPDKLPFPEAGRTWPRFVIARPDRMQPVKNKATGELLGWIWMDAGGKRHDFDLSQVIHFELWNPYDDCLGLGEMEPAKNSAEADYLAGTYEANLWRNNGDRGPIIGLPAGVMLTDEQRAQFIAQLREKKELASRGIFKTIFVDSDIKIEDPKAQNIDAAVIASRASDATQIAIAFGVPPSMFTVAASYSIGSASDRYRLIEDTSAPTAKKISEGIERIASRQIGGGASVIASRRVYAWFDWSKHSVFAQVRMERIEGASKVWDRGAPWETINDWLNLGLPEFDGWDQGYLPFSVTPADQLAAQQEQQATDFNEPGAIPADAPQPSGGDAADAVQAMCHALHTKVAKARPAHETKLLRKHQLARRPAIKRFESAFEVVLKKARAEVLRKLSTFNVERSTLNVLTKTTAADFLFSLSDFTAELKTQMRRASNAALRDAGQQLFAEIGLDDPFRFPPEKALTFLSQRENKLSGVPTEVFNQVKEKIESGLVEGDSIAKITNAVKDEFNGIAKGRAKTIAMTETAAAYGAARQDAMEQSGVPFKKWLTSGAPNVRPAHQEANGQTVSVDEPFIVDGEALDGPGDPSGSPGNVINCHCIAIAVMKDSGDIE